MAELMKGKRWLDRKDAVDRKGNPIVKYPVDVQPKMDEIRLHVKAWWNTKTELWNVSFLSYAEKPLHNLGAYAEEFAELMVRTGYSELDCGVEVNGNFNDSYRYVRSSTGIPEDLIGKPVKFYLYDLPQATLPWLVRKEVVGKVCAASQGLLHNVMSTEAYSAKDVERRYLELRALGYEGAMIKSLQHTYQKGKRIDGWWKYKPEKDADGMITSIFEAVSMDGVPLGRAGSVVVLCEDNSGAVPHGIPHELGRDMFNNPENYLGQWCEFKYMERDRQGGYRHPTFYRLREAKA